MGKRLAATNTDVDIDNGTITTMKLSNIKIDNELLELRPLNGSYVSRYRRAMRFGGLRFGADGWRRIILDKKTKRIVSGNQRYAAMIQEFGDDYIIQVRLRKYKNRLELVEHAVIENLKTGRELEGFEAKRFRKCLHELNASYERISQLFDRSVKSVKRELAGFIVVTSGTAHKSKRNAAKTTRSVKVKGIKIERREPVKCSIPKSVTEMTERQWEEQKDKDIGVKLSLLVGQIIRHINNNFIDPSDESTLKELYFILKKRYSE